MSIIRKNIKSRFCRTVMNGCSCEAGDKCRFAHSSSELVPIYCRHGKNCRNITCRRLHPLNKIWWIHEGTSVSGPFQTKQMKGLEVKLRERSDLLIGLSPVGPFKPLPVVYPDHEKSFLFEPDMKVWGIRPAIRSPKFTKDIRIDTSKLNEYKDAEKTDDDDLTLYGLISSGSPKYPVLLLPPPPVLPPTGGGHPSHTKTISVSFVSGVDLREKGVKPNPRRLSHEDSKHLINKIIKEEYNDKGLTW